MKIIALLENTTTNPSILCEHGLSLYIETDSEKILFDMGASDHFISNAAKLGVDLSLIDLAVLSHGHNDHGGGLAHFLSLNKKAPVYLNRKALGDYFVKRQEFVPIGLPKVLTTHPQVHLVEDVRLNERLRLFSEVTGDVCRPTGNSTLYKKEQDADYSLDDFAHEQNLVITQGEQSVLICGCAHNGILNILDRYYEQEQRYPDVVIGGFHLHNPTTKTDENPDVIAQIAEYMRATKATYYTCHCTGENSYNLLKQHLGEQISYLRAGDTIKI